MGLIETLCLRLGPRIAKLLLARYLGKAGESFAGDFVDVIADHFKGPWDRRQATREFERLSERIVEEILPMFAEAESQHLCVEPVIAELDATLKGKISAKILLAKDLDTRQITAELKRLHRVQPASFSEAEGELYEAALQGAIRYLVEIADQLPDFEATQARESLKRLSKIEAVLDETAEMVERVVSWVAKQGDGRLNQQYETEYRLAVRRNLDYVLLFGANITDDSKRQSLSVAYISLNLTETRDGRETTKPLAVEAGFQTLTPTAGRLLIKGEAGSGKSTLFRWAAIEAAVGSEREQSLRKIAEKAPTTRFDSIDEERARQTWRSKIPFLVRLRNCRGGSLPGPDELPELIAKEIGHPPADWVTSVLRAGRALVLLDGIDELPNFDREIVKEEIRKIVEAYPENYFIASTRPAATREWLPDLGFREAWLNPMTDNDRSLFIDRWHLAVAEELRKLDRPRREQDELARLASSLKEALASNPEIARLATNPLLCAAICALHRKKNRYLPDSLRALCDSLCYLLLDRDPTKGIQGFPEPYGRLSTEQRRALVREIAYYMVFNDEPHIPIERARKEIANVLRLFPGHSPADADTVCDCLVERCGMLREIEIGSLDFVHNTFKEFLAGDRFADSGHSGFLAKHALSQPWQNVVLFAVTTSRPEFASELISRLLKLKPGEFEARGIEDRTRARMLLALRCRAAALFVLPELEDELLRIVEEMAPPRNMEEAEVFASLGNAAIRFLRFEQGHDSGHSASCVRALRLIGTNQAQAALETYTKDRRKEVILELAQAIHPLKIRSYREDLLTGGDDLLRVAQRVTDLRPLELLPIEKKKDVRELNLTGAAISDLSPIAAMTAIESLHLSGTKIKDLAPLAGMVNLRILDISGTQVTDLSPLARLKSLARLDLSGTQVATLEPLAGLVNLEWLDIVQTRVRDVKPLAGLKNLRHFDWRDTLVSHQSVIAVLPHLKILDLRPTETMAEHPAR